MSCSYLAAGKSTGLPRQCAHCLAMTFLLFWHFVFLRHRYTGPSLEAVLDRLPTAQVLSEDANGWLISAEVFGKGIEMWLRSQGEWVEQI